MPRGRGFRWSGYGWPGWGRGNPTPYCRWYPWLPRGWWTGMYGPVTPWQGMPYAGYGPYWRW